MVFPLIARRLLECRPQPAPSGAALWSAEVRCFRSQGAECRALRARRLRLARQAAPPRAPAPPGSWRRGNRPDSAPDPVPHAPPSQPSADERYVRLPPLTRCSGCTVLLARFRLYGGAAEFEGRSLSNRAAHAARTAACFQSPL